MTTPLGGLGRRPEADGICPTGCGRSVNPGKLMCGPCWSVVPRPLQREVTRTWKAYRRADLERAKDTRAAYLRAREDALASIP